MKISLSKRQIAYLLVILLLLLVLTGLAIEFLSLKPATETAFPEPKSLPVENLEQVSPDGAMKAYVSATDAGMHGTSIFLSKADGTDASVIASGSDGAWVTNPVWSPDGKNIAFVRVVDSQISEFEISSEFELWVYNLAAGKSRLITAVDTFNPSISYDGSSDIKWRSDTEIAFPDNESYPINDYVVDINTGKITQLDAGAKAGADKYNAAAQPGKVPYYSQCDSSWGNTTLGTCSQYNVCEMGCAISATAMVFKYYGVKTDPGAMNTWLKNHNGYTNGCLINWTTAANMAPDKVTFIARITTPDWARLRSELNNGYPVILEVRNNGAQHFVVATGYYEDTYYINDPGYPSRTTLAAYGNKIVGLRIFHGPTSAPAQCPPSTDGEVYVCTPKIRPEYKADFCASKWYPLRGFSGNTAYLVENAANDADYTHAGSWTPKLSQAGIYKVEAFIPRHGTFSKTCSWGTASFGADTSQAKYVIIGAGGAVTEAIRDQLPMDDEWLTIGEFEFDAGTGGNVHMKNATGEAAGAKNLSYSAMRFTYLRPGSYPVPAITSVSPPAAQSGMGDLTITLNGTGFYKESVVSLNGSNLATTYKTQKQLTAVIPAGQLAKVAELSIVVTNPAPGGGSSTPYMFGVSSFADSTPQNWHWRFVESLYAQGITTGCAVSPMRYCPDRAVTRGEMAVFLLRAMHAGDNTYLPAPKMSDYFLDVPEAGKDWMKPWIEEFYEEGISTGCAVNLLRYCPERPVTRAEMAVFILRALHGEDYVPPAALGIFSDVPAPGREWMAPWVEQFYNEGITTGCGVDAAGKPLYCPERPVTRAEMAAFIDRAFDFPLLP